jgi:glycosyltransferase involved in cell wall biosynthesis
MKILIVHNDYAKFSGEEEVVSQNIAFLKKRHEVIEFRKTSKALKDTLRDKFKAFFSGIYSRKSVLEFRKCLIDQKPDLVHVHNLYPLISPAILPECKRLHIPVVMTVHNYRLICPCGLFYNKHGLCEKCSGGKEWNCMINNCEKTIFKSTGYALRNYFSRIKGYYLDNIDLFCCLTNFQKNKLVENGFDPNKISVLPNSIEVKENNDKLMDGSYVGYVGRISQEKGIHFILEAARLLPDINFKFAGTGDEKFIRELEIPANVEMLGFVKGSELLSFYRRAKFFIMGSCWYEGFPTILPVIMSEKKAIIVPDIGGLPEIVRNEINGLVFHSGDTCDLVCKINYLWQNEQQRYHYALKGYEICLKEYSTDKYYKALMRYYNALVENKG